MSWTDPETKSTGNLITAAYWNQMLGPSGNQVLTAPGVFTTAGDIIYGTGDNATTRLASSGGGGKFLQMNGGATAPAWVTALTSLVADTTPQLGGFLDANGNYIQMQKGGDIASASPTVIDTDGDYFSVTGTTNFSAFTVAADRHFFLEFAGVLTITHGAGTIDLPGGANITTAASDVGEFVSTAANVVTCVNYTRASGKAVIETVTSVSGSTGAVADGDIDHDSLANFAANEHYTQANITTIGTVTSGTISTGAVIDDPTMTQGSDATGDVYYRSAAGKLTRLATGADGTVLTSTGAGAVPAFEAVADDAGIRNDIATLALHTAIADNKAAYNLSNAFIDQFEDDSGIDAESTTDRHASEYVATEGGAADTDVKLLLHMDGTNGTYNFVDSSPSAHTMTRDGTPTHHTAEKKFGASSATFDGSGDTVHTSSTHADFTFGTGDFTIEGWFYWTPAVTHDGQRFFTGGTPDSGEWSCYGNDANKSNIYAFGSGPFTQTADTSTWNHYAWVRESGSLAMYRNGTEMGSSPYANTTDFSAAGGFALGRYGAGDGWNGLIDEVRICRSAKYSANFTPAATAFDPGGIVSSGNFTSATQTASGSVSTMGIVVLYKNETGTATLNTDLVAEVSANGGTNYASATLVAGGTFSTGINIAAVSGVSVTAGTAPKYKISFANQSWLTKHTQVHGVALLY